MLLGSRGSGVAAAQDATPGTAGGYLVIHRYRLRSGTDCDELMRLVDAGFIPIVAGLPGFLEYLLVNPGGEEHGAVSVFADQAGADESTAAAGNWAAENVAAFVELPTFEVIGGPVRLHVLGAGMSGPSSAIAAPPWRGVPNRPEGTRLTRRSPLKGLSTGQRSARSP